MHLFLVLTRFGSHYEKGLCLNIHGRAVVCCAVLCLTDHGRAVVCCAMLYSLLLSA